MEDEQLFLCILHGDFVNCFCAFCMEFLSISSHFTVTLEVNKIEHISEEEVFIFSTTKCF